MRGLALLLLACSSAQLPLATAIEAGVENGLAPDELRAQVGEPPIVDTRRHRDRDAVRMADYEMLEGDVPLTESETLIYWRDDEDRVVGALWRDGEPTLWRARVLEP